MKLKTIITIALLLFVAASITFLIVHKSGDSSAMSLKSSTDSSETDNQLPGHRLIVYYFHGTARCPTCLTLEKYSKEAVETMFPDELTSGRIEWKVVNYDESWNEHYLQDYDLSYQSLVLVEINDGKEVRFKNLEKIWDLVDNKPGYMEYVEDSIASYLARL